MRIHVVTLLALGIALGACGAPAEKAAPEATEAKPAAPPAPAPAPPAAPPSERVDDPTFELAAVASGPYAAGKLSSFAVSLKPRGEYHVNQDYPMSIALSAGEGLQFPKTQLGKPEAAEFGEKVARFDVPFTGKPGTHKVTANVKFAVCTPENCVPDERTLAVVLPVE